jgi:Skp family chaperone for outer membrane proteins
MTKFVQMFVLLSFVFAPALVCADEAKIATVDMGRILNESKQGQAKRRELDVLSASAKKKVEERKATIQALDKKMKTSKTDEDSKEMEAFRVQARDFSRFVKDTEDGLKKEYVKSNRELLDASMKTIASIADKKKVDLVLDRSEKVRGPVLFGSKQTDITNDVLAELNR